MIKIISANLNGIRSAAKKGFFDWLHSQDAEIICVQEIRAQASDMTVEFQSPGIYHGNFHYAEKKGYAGTGIYSRARGQMKLISINNGEKFHFIFELSSGKAGD